MTYSVVYGNKAEAKLGALPPMVASKLMDEVDRLACADPYELLEPWYYLYRPVGWYFSCDLEDDDGRRYGVKCGVEVRQPDRTVWIEYIAWQGPY